MKKLDKDLDKNLDLDEEVLFYSLMPDHLCKDEEFLEVWSDWLNHRKEIKKPLTPTAAKRQIKQLGKFKPKVATAMVDRSITSSWQGIFELQYNHPLLRIDQGLQDPDSQQGEPLKPVY